MALPREKREAYVGGIRALAEIIRRYVQRLSMKSSGIKEIAGKNFYQEVCLRNTLNLIRAVTTASPNSQLAMDLVDVLSKVLGRLKRLSPFS